MEINTTINKFINNLYPNEDNIEACLGYGSGVFEQHEYNTSKKKKIDIILVLKKFDDYFNYVLGNHQEYSDYIRKIKLLSCFLKNIPFYIGQMPFEDNIYKVGIITKDGFIADIDNIRSLSGRVQKPIKVIRGNSNVDIMGSINLSRKRGYALAKVLTEKDHINKSVFKKFSYGEDDLLFYLTSLSYVGDIRTLVGIDTKNKMKSIVKGSLEHNNTYENYDKTISKGEVSDIIDNWPLLKEREKGKSIEKKSNLILSRLTRKNFYNSYALCTLGLLINGIHSSKSYLDYKFDSQNKVKTK